MPAGDNKVARYVSPGSGAESGLQAHDYEDTGRLDSSGVPILRPRVASPDLVPLLDGLEGLLADLKTYTDGLEGLLTEIRDNADTLEASFATLNAKDFATAAKQDTLAGKVPDEEGSWDYSAGASGTVNIPAGRRVLGIAATGGTAAASLTINGGASVPIPANMSVEFAPRGNLVAPTLVFTSTASFLVEHVG